MNLRKLFSDYVSPLAGIVGAFFGEYPDDDVNDDNADIILGVYIGLGVAHITVAERLDDGRVRIARTLEEEFNPPVVARQGFHEYLMAVTGIDKCVVYVSNHSGLPDGVLTDSYIFDSNTACEYTIVPIKIGMRPFIKKDRVRFFNVKSMLVMMAVDAMRQNRIINDAGIDLSWTSIGESEYEYAHNGEFKIKQGWGDGNIVSMILVFSAWEETMIKDS